MFPQRLLAVHVEDEFLCVSLNGPQFLPNTQRAFVKLV